MSSEPYCKRKIGKNKKEEYKQIRIGTLNIQGGNSKIKKTFEGQ